MSFFQAPSLDVFISWTGRDALLKDQICQALRAAGISVLESDGHCCAEFMQWSRTAARAGSVLVLLLSEHTLSSAGVAEEMEVFTKLAGYESMLLPVCTSLETYSRDPWGFHTRVSALELQGTELTPALEEQLVQKVRALLIGQMDRLYRYAVSREPIRLAALYRNRNVRDQEPNYSELYIPRRLRPLDGEAVSAAQLTRSRDISFISGPAGSGKSCYIRQLREAADDDTLVLCLSCSKLIQSKERVFEAMYREFSHRCGDLKYFSPEHFRTLLRQKHLLLILDGMDEIPTQAQTRKLLDSIREYYSVNLERTSLVFTGRSPADAGLVALCGQQVRSFALEQLSPEDIRALSNKLFLLFRDEKLGRDFYARVVDLDREIISNPLLLSQLAMIYRDTGDVPQTVVGIYDKLSQILFRQEALADTEVPESYRDMLGTGLSGLLKEFSATRYRLHSQNKAPEKLFAKLLRERYPQDNRERAEFLVEYLEKRAILVEDRFCHKLLLEYFTAVYYYEHCFDDLDELADMTRLEELSSHYREPYWAPVLQLFLVKADSLIDADTSRQLYAALLTRGIEDYTVLLAAAQALGNHRLEVQTQIAGDILQKSVDGTFPAYGPLFWYVPEYDLYEALALALQAVPGAKALALVRDVCFIFGQKYALSQVTDRVDGARLLQAAQTELTGVRKALCQLFYTGKTDDAGDADIYPRCFHVAEAKAFLETGCGLSGTVTQPFQDELGLYSHDDLPTLAGEFIGFASCTYDVDAIEKTLNSRPCRKLRGLALAAPEQVKLEYIAIDRSHLQVVYLPENSWQGYVPPGQPLWDAGLQLLLSIAYRQEGKRMYVHKKAALLSQEDYGQLAGCAHLEHALVPEGFVRIPTGSFQNCPALTRVDIPQSVTQIGDRAFAGCAALTSLQLPDGLAQIGSEAFRDCAALAEIQLPPAVIQLKPRTFENCASLQKLSFYATQLGEYALRGCASLESVTLPEGLSHIRKGAFRDCSQLRQVQLPESLSRIGDEAFRDCVSLEQIELPEGLQALGDNAFAGCVKLRQVQLPDGLEQLGTRAFAGCTSLEEFHMPANAEIMWGTLHGCINLRKVTVPQGIIELDMGAFEGCVKLTRITLPDTLEMIGNRVFAGCTGLQELTIPESVRAIGGSAFAGCTSLRTITIPQGVTTLYEKTFDGCSSLEAVQLPESLEHIRKHAFRGTALKTVYLPWKTTVDPEAFAPQVQLLRYGARPSWAHWDIPEGTTQISEIPEGVISVSVPASMTVIEEWGFGEMEKLQAVQLPPTLTAIGAWAFSYCRKLQQLELPDSVTELGENAFSGCSGLRQLRLPGRLTALAEQVLWGCSGLKQLGLPDGLTEIGESALEGCSGLTALSLPGSLRVIGEAAFRGCTGLTALTIPQGVTQISHYLLENCTALKSVTLPQSITEIGRYAFRNCPSLASIAIPEGVTRLGAGAFAGCAALEEVALPAGLQVLPGGTFFGCTGLRRVQLPAGLTQVLCEEFGHGCFEGCVSLEDITLPEGLTHIGARAFAGCTSLRRLTVPASVRYLEPGTFAGCTGLEEVTLSHRFAGQIAAIFPDSDPNIFRYI